MAFGFPESVPVFSPYDDNEGGVVHLLRVLVNFPVIICEILCFQAVLQWRLLCFIDPAVLAFVPEAFLCDFVHENCLVKHLHGFRVWDRDNGITESDAMPLCCNSH